MRGKYKNPLHYAIAFLHREQLRAKVAGLAKWEPLNHAEPGCTAIIGALSRLPSVLAANLHCLQTFRWPELKRVLIVWDCTPESLPAEARRITAESYPELPIEFLYYSPYQSQAADQLMIPWVYSWLSWCIAIGQTVTEHVLLHDYDALVLGPALETRYKVFAPSGVKVQGIRWYHDNGIEPSDHLATTFEAFFDTRWLRSLRPVHLFNKLRIIRGRSIDFDTTLDAQLAFLQDKDRAAMPMEQDQLLHPSQMLCQYTSFRRFPGRPLPCGAIPQIPFMAFVGGLENALSVATEALQAGRRDNVELLKDGTEFNFAQLDVAMIDWQLKMMVQGCLALDIQPDRRIYRYGEALYRIIAAPQSIWKGDFTSTQRRWIDSAAKA